jgi:hypothetical protein
MSRYWLLKVNAPHFDSLCVWKVEKTPSGPEWECIEADPFSMWMKGRKVSDVGAYLKSRKYKYRWIKENIANSTDAGNDSERAWRELLKNVGCIGK